MVGEGQRHLTIHSGPGASLTSHRSSSRSTQAWLKLARFDPESAIAKESTLLHAQVLAQQGLQDYSTEERGSAPVGEAPFDLNEVGARCESNLRASLVSHGAPQLAPSPIPPSALSAILDQVSSSAKVLSSEVSIGAEVGLGAHSLLVQIEWTAHALESERAAAVHEFVHTAKESYTSSSSSTQHWKVSQKAVGPDGEVRGRVMCTIVLYLATSE